MNVIRQILIVFGICLLATVISGLLPFTLPASVLAILLLAGLLAGTAHAADTGLGSGSAILDEMDVAATAAFWASGW